MRVMMIHWEVAANTL